MISMTFKHYLWNIGVRYSWYLSLWSCR